MRLFDLYAKNLSIVKKHSSVTMSTDIDDVFACPLCLRVFSREEARMRQVSVEHVPPKKLGGIPKTLTCKKCNNMAGTHLESKLRKNENFRNVLDLQVGAEHEIEYSLNDESTPWLPATFKITETGMQIIGDPNRTNPKDLEKLRDSIKTEGVNDFTARFATPVDSITNISKLRIAYLLAFSVFGYGFLINPNLEIIRKQILDPKTELLPSFGIITQNLTDFSLGFNVIREPKIYKSSLVVFDLIVDTQKRRYGVILPGPDVDDMNIYNLFMNNGTKSFEISHLQSEKLFEK
ncbi:MAG: HNH endonuclease [Aggregatilineales bacterium]